MNSGNRYKQLSESPAIKLKLLPMRSRRISKIRGEHSPAFKAQVAWKAVRGEETVAQRGCPCTWRRPLPKLRFFGLRITL